MKIIILTFLLVTLTYNQNHAQQNKVLIDKYIPINEKVYSKIIEMDSIFFSAYNNCDIQKQTAIYADELEFFHDKGGLITSKKEVLESTEKFICNKVTRKVLKKTIEVYPIKDYGAVEIGFHEFYNNQESKTIP